MIQYDMQSIGLINLFEKTTGAKVKDCFQEGEGLVFIVQQRELRKALENNGEKIKKFSALTKKRVKLIEFNEDVQKFVQNLLYPLKPELEWKEGVLFIKGKDAKEKGQIYGREKTNFKRLQKIVNKYFKIEIRIL